MRMVAKLLIPYISMLHLPLSALLLHRFSLPRFGDKGSVTLSTPTGGTGTISFDGTATTNLGEGDYTYTATDENGCKTSHTVHINAAPSAISFTATPVQPTCFGDKVL
ncbi:MAG: hypothetical protein U0U33_02990 [Chitinophagaceae bacterium]